MIYFMEDPTKMDDLGVPVYRQWFAELAGRYNASEEECKKQHAAAKVELRNVAQKVLLGTSDPSETTNQSLVVGGMCRIHCVATQDLMQKVTTVTEQWIKSLGVQNVEWGQRPWRCSWWLICPTSPGSPSR